MSNATQSPARVADIVEQLITCAVNPPAPATCCACECSEQPLYVVGDGSLRCQGCVSPFDARRGVEFVRA